MEKLLIEDYILTKTFLTFRDGLFSFGGTNIIKAEQQKAKLVNAIRIQKETGPDFARQIMKDDVAIHCSYDNEEAEWFSAWAELDTEEDESGKKVKLTFYEKWEVTDRKIPVPEKLMYKASSIIHDEEIADDIRNMLDGMYETGLNDDWLTPWKLEFMRGDRELMKQMVARYWQYASAEEPHNTTIRQVIEDSEGVVQLEDDTVEGLWKIFNDIAVDDDGEYLRESFMDFEPYETTRADVYHWFNEHYSKGVRALIDGGEVGTCTE